MKHRADVMQAERPASTQTGGRHAVAPKDAPKDAPKQKLPKAAKPAKLAKTPKPAKTPKAAKPARPAKPAKQGRLATLAARRSTTATLEPGQDPRLDVVAGEEGTLAGDVVEVAGPAPVVPGDLAALADTAASAVLETVAEPRPVVVHRPAEAAEAPTEEERLASPLTSTGKWRTRNPLRNLTFVLLVAAAAATGLAARYYFESTTSSRMRLLVTACLVVAGLWALLTATAPQVVTLKGSVLTVKSRRGTDRFDLAEGMQQLELIGDPNSSKWALVLHRGDNTVVRLNRRDVDARTIDPLVRKFREIAERRRSEHWARMGL